MDEELRIAVVMNGGVSLAVWIGGVTLEMGRLVAGESAYGEIQKLTGSTVRVDVICGTSAGGVNGAFLALAMAHHRRDLGPTLALLRSLWVSKGSIGDLLRDPFTAGSRSLLDGDGYFLESLREAFAALETRPVSNPSDVPIDLVMTTTLLRGLEREYADDFGSRIRDVSHRANFEFRRGPGSKDDAFAAPDIANQLALAARCTASFPAAFEPSFCPVGTVTDHPFRPDMKDIASFPSSRFVIDGGVLDNSPVDFALERIYHQRAEGPVRRVLAYVVPDPGTTARKRDGGTDKPDKLDELPELLDVGVASLVRIPAVQSISAQLQQLREHNDKIRARRRARVLLTRHNSPEAIDGLAKTLFAAYRAQRVDDALDYVVFEISKGLVAKGSYGLGRRGRREWLRRTIADMAQRLPWVPNHPPHSPDAAAERSIDGWRWGTRPVEHLARLLLDIVIGAEGVAEGVATLLSRPAALEDKWKAAYDILEKIEKVRGRDREYWRNQAQRVLDLLGDGKSGVHDERRARQWVAEACAGWQATAYRQAAELLHDIARHLLEMRETISMLTAAAAGSADLFLRDQADDLRNLFGYMVRSENDAEPEVIARMLAFEITQDALGGRGTIPNQDIEFSEVGALGGRRMIPDQEIEFIEISARSRSTFGGPEEPAHKLAGIQLVHFGAFYKSSWRANDWMWGRVDAVHRLVRILLDPERLRIAARKFPAGQRARMMAEEVRRIAISTTDPGLAAELKRSVAPPEHLEAELAYLDNDAMIVPEALPLAVDALSRRLEGEILSSELPRLADAAEEDWEAGSFGSEAAKSFVGRCRKVTTSGIVQGDQLRDLVSICDIGKERLEQEVGTDRLSTIATQAIAVAVSSMRTETGLLAIAGKLLAVLRSPTLLFYVFARDAKYHSRTAVAIGAAALAAGFVILLTHVFAEAGHKPYNATLLALGVAAIAAPMAWAAWKWPGIARKIGAVLAILVLAVVVVVLVGAYPLPGSTQAWQSIAAGSLGVLVLLLAAGFWPVRRRTVRR
jgi:patatin-related protein